MSLIALKNGPVLPDAAIMLALDLERDGFLLTVSGDTLRLSGGTQPLTTNQRESITQWKLHLIEIAKYDPPQP